MALEGVLIARGSIVLAEYCPSKTNFPVVGRRILEEVKLTQTRKSYSHEGYLFHLLVDDGIVYLCMSRDLGHEIPFQFLIDVMNRFKSSFGRDKIQTAGAGAMNSNFHQTLQTRLEFYSRNQEGDKLKKVKGQVEEAKETMMQNLDKVVTRGERIEILLDKTDSLQHQSHSFKRKGAQLKRKMWWRNIRLMCFLTCILVLILIGVVCGVLVYTGEFKKVYHKAVGKHSKLSSKPSFSNLVVDMLTPEEQFVLFKNNCKYVQFGWRTL